MRFQRGGKRNIQSDNNFCRSRKYLLKIACDTKDTSCKNVLL